MTQLVEKLVAHTQHLLDLFIALKEKYALLDPMIFDEDVIKCRGSGRREQGFVTLRHVLLFDCIQDIAKLAFDRDKRTPSVINILCGLSDNSARTEVRKRFAVPPKISWIGGVPGPRLVRQLEDCDEKKRQIDFDSAYRALLQKWSAFKGQRWVAGFKSIRDKITAHAEAHPDANGKYRLTDISSFSLCWGDIGQALRMLQDIVVDLLFIVCCGTIYKMDSVDALTRRDSKNFWA